MKDFKKILAHYWGYTEFRTLQFEIIESVASGKDTLGLMPTGGGKSIIFQVYSLSQKGICIVITPLIALMKDQVENLNRRGIKALAIHSGMSSAEIKIVLDNAVWGNYKFLYISPERLNSERFTERLVKMDVNLITVDEAHCISQWGYDFRPSYLNIAALRNILPNVKFLALTATATTKVANDIQDKLEFKDKNIFSMSFSRHNLSYIVRHLENKIGYILETLGKTSGSGIIYVRSRKVAHEISDELRKYKISADFYHAGLNTHLRNVKHDMWINGKTRVIVATNAFGMGIDKPDVRFVIHWDAPDSLEAYYQEAGRAGRDGKKSAAVLLFNNIDKTKLKRRIPVAFPEITSIKKIYNSLCNYLNIAEGFGKEQKFGFSLQGFAQVFGYQQTMVYNSLKILQREGYIEYIEEVDNLSKVYFTVSRDDLYKFQVANANFDGFIKLLLRSYTGLFSDYVVIDEELLAKNAGLDRENIYKFLKHLRKSKVIDYIPRSNMPCIFFNRERVGIERLKISNENYGLRKKDFQERIDAVIRYAENNECRSNILINYFGENSTVRCGQCDVCKSLETIDISNTGFDEISGIVKTILEEPCTYEKLLLKIKDNQEKTIQVIRWLIDNKKIIFRIDNKLEWIE
ncbi:MAG: RecQ family ATP-dependent DNA helicase [Bacteroidales bacterium]|jgi:ATP-dependent DNA helicase RecQ|nr:RecQ family ATP-dependent DNA helicase [Bacteroidales bacterium]